MSELVKPFLKNQIEKLKESENQCQNTACEQKTNSDKSKLFKHKNRSRMSDERIGKTI